MKKIKLQLLIIIFYALSLGLLPIAKILEKKITQKKNLLEQLENLED